MKITHQMLQDDIINIARTLKHKSVEIPSAWDSMKLGLGSMLGLILWQAFVAYPEDPRNDSAEMSMLFSGFLSFLIFMAMFSGAAKYLSLPAEIRQYSIAIKLVRDKTRAYIKTWLAINVMVGLLCKFLPFLPSMISALSHFVTLLFMFMIYNVDMSRYDLSLFSSVITAWKEGKDPKSALERTEATPGIAGD